MLVTKERKKIFRKKGFQGTTNEMNHVMLLLETKHLGLGYSSGKLAETGPVETYGYFDLSVAISYHVLRFNIQSPVVKFVVTLERGQIGEHRGVLERIEVHKGVLVQKNKNC